MLERDEGSISWPRFKVLCQQRFGPPLLNNFLGEAARLQFRSTVEDYQDCFAALIYHANPTPALHQQASFSPLVSLDASASMSNSATHMTCNKRWPWPGPMSAALRGPTAAWHALACLPAAPTPATTAPGAAELPASPPVAPTFKRLTPAEMMERRKQGLCYNCAEPFVRGHRCQRLFYLEVADDDKEDTVEGAPVPNSDTPIISLLAMTGVSTL